MRHRLTLLSCLLAALLMLLSSLPCQAQPGVGAAGPNARYTDATGAQLRFGMQAKRIVSMAPNVTEMLCFLGFEPQLVGRSDFCDYPPEVKDLPTIGGFIDASLERIVALKPDLVVAYQGNDRELVDQLRQTGITVLAFNEAATLEEIGEQMATLASIAGVAAGDPPPPLAQWQIRLEQLSQRAKIAGGKPTVFFGYPGEMSLSASPASFVGDFINSGGASNIVPSGDERWPNISAEFIVAAKPEWILTATDCVVKTDATKHQADLLKQLRYDPVWKVLPAVRNKHLLVLDSALLLRPGPRILDAFEQFVNAIHPAADGSA
jgi:iron complex transport system substrate-binding protein